MDIRNFRRFGAPKLKKKGNFTLKVDVALEKQFSREMHLTKTEQTPL